MAYRCGSRLGWLGLRGRCNCGCLSSLSLPTRKPPGKSPRGGPATTPAAPRKRAWGPTRPRAARRSVGAPVWDPSGRRSTCVTHAVCITIPYLLIEGPIRRGSAWFTHEDTGHARRGAGLVRGTEERLGCDVHRVRCAAGRRRDRHVTVCPGRRIWQETSEWGRRGCGGRTRRAGPARYRHHERPRH